MSALLQTIQEEFHTTLQTTRSSTPRDYKFPESKQVIKVAVGMRRSGKTTFLIQTASHLADTGVALNQMLYLNFEDDRLFPLTHKEMGAMVDSWYSLHPKNHDQCCYLFFDEVQNIEGWQLVLRRLLDTKNVQMYVTGSSAKLLSKEIATSLRGRSLALEILPYNYKEYLTAHKLALPTKPFGQKALDQQRAHLLDYFEMGGFPGVQEMPPNERLESLQLYVDTVIFRDIVERHQISNVALLRYFIQTLLKNTASLFSINKFYNDIKSQGQKVGKDTLHTYLSYLEDAFLIFAVPIFTESLRKLQTTPKKIYAIDNGLITANTFNRSPNMGKRLENQVYLDLRRAGKKVFYYQTREGYEVDFVTQDREGRYELIQVVWDESDPETREREERALKAAEEELGFPGRIIDSASYLQDLGN